MNSLYTMYHRTQQVHSVEGVRIRNARLYNAYELLESK